MPLENLNKLRQKYPQYNDIGDQDLAKKFISKYPQYQDILGDIADGGVVKSTSTATVSPETEKTVDRKQMYQDILKRTGEQKFPEKPIFSKGDIPEMVGSMAGIAGKTTPMGMVLSGAGAMGGEIVKQVGQAAGKIEGEPPRNFTESIGRQAGAFARGAGGEALGRKVIAPIISKFAAPFAKDVPQEVVRQAESLKSIGGEAPVSSLSESPYVQGTERFAEYSPFGSKIRNIKDNAIKVMKDFATTISDGISEEKPIEFVQDTITNRLDDFAKVFRKKSNEIYEPIMKEIGKTKPVLNNTIQTLETILERRSGVAEPSGLNLIREWLSEIKPKSYESAVEGGAIVRERPMVRELQSETNVGSRRITPESEMAGTDVLAGQSDYVSPLNREVSEARKSISLRSARQGASESGTDLLMGKESGKSLKNELVGAYQRGRSLEAPSGVPGMLTPEPEGAIDTLQGLRNFRSSMAKRASFDDPATTGIKKDLEALYGAVSEDIYSTANQVSPEAGKALKEADEYFATGINKLKDKMLKFTQRKIKDDPDNIYKLYIKRDSPTLVNMGKELLGDEGFNQVKKQWFDRLIQESTKVIEGKEVLSPQILSNNIKRLGSTVEAIFADNPEQLAQFNILKDSANLLTRGQKVTQGSQTKYLESVISPIGFIRDSIAAALVNTETGKKFLTTGLPQLGNKTYKATRPLIQIPMLSASDKILEDYKEKRKKYQK